MITPQEIEVWYVIPAIRRELTLALKEEGLKQRQVAEILDVTEAAVSQYMKSKRAGEVKFGPEMKKEIKKSARKLVKGAHLMPEIQRIIRLTRKNRITCGLNSTCKHKGEICKVCLK